MDSSLENAIILLKIIICVSVHLTMYMNLYGGSNFWARGHRVASYSFLNNCFTWQIHLVATAGLQWKERERQADGWVVKCR